MNKHVNSKEIDKSIVNITRSEDSFKADEFA